MKAGCVALLFFKSSAKRTVYHKEVRSLNLGSASYIHRLIGFHKVKYGLSVNNVVQLAYRIEQRAQLAAS